MPTMTVIKVVTMRKVMTMSMMTMSMIRLIKKAIAMVNDDDTR